MAGGHVPDLVPEDAHELGLVVEKRNDAAREIDEPARQRECVDCRLIDHRELPGKIGPLRQLRQTQAEIAHVALQLGVVVDPHLRFDLRVGVAAERDLLRLAHQRELAASRHRIGRAGGNERHEHEGQQPRPPRE
jgi:hypothetical protein